MFLPEKKVFITEYVGLSTRLEALAMAFLISDYYGHQVCLDWGELDSFNVVGARREGPGLLGRMNCLKIRDYSDELFFRIPGYHNVNLRHHNGPKHLLQRLYLPTAERVKLRPDLVQIIRDTFVKYKQRPVVALHVRRGDFTVASEHEYDVNATTWPAVPEWWYEHVMGKIQAAYPDVAFFISCSGSSEAFPNLKKNFDLFELPTSFPYAYKGPDHAAMRHPSSDLFALGCCNLMLGTPCSTFTHYAAHMLGKPTTVLVPPAHKITRQQPGFAQACLYGRSAFEWYDACRLGRELTVVKDMKELPVPVPANPDWM